MAQIARSDPRDYAIGLWSYAGSRLDDATLHSWMIQRLMPDLRLEHARAALLIDEVISMQRDERLPGCRPQTMRLRAVAPIRRLRGHGARGKRS